MQVELQRRNEWRTRGIKAPSFWNIPPANQYAAMKSAKSASADFRNAPLPNPRRRVLHVWQTRFQPPARKNHRWIGIVAPRQAYPLRRINSRLSKARNPPPRISETHPSTTREGGFCVLGRRGFNPRRAKNQLSGRVPPRFQRISQSVVDETASLC